jgi:Abortive infection alpha
VYARLRAAPDAPGSAVAVGEPSAAARIMDGMSEEIELAAKTTGAVVGAVIESSGITKPMQEITGWLAAWIHPRLVASAAKQMMAAVEKLRTAGITPGAVRDERMRRLLEEGAREEDNDLRDMWANLLANGLAGGPNGVRRAFSETLAQLEPVEAVLLNAILTGTRVQGTDSGVRVVHGPAGKGLKGASWDNLERRLGLVQLQQLGNTGPPVLGPTGHAEELKQVGLTPFGKDFMNACEPPKAEPDESEGEGSR